MARSTVSESDPLETMRLHIVPPDVRRHRESAIRSITVEPGGAARGRSAPRADPVVLPKDHQFSRGNARAAPIRPTVNVRRTIGSSGGPISLVSLESASDHRWFPGAVPTRANVVASNEGSS